MRKQTILENLKFKLASIGWKLFIWGSGYTEEEYWESVYQQELHHRATYDNCEEHN